MPPKKQIPQPIDRPLSRAYLREFTGWSTAYPPGISDPTSLRIMENVMVNRDGSARVRPGLKFLSKYFDEGESWYSALPNRIVGTHETFFLNDGSKAYLFAVKENDGTVGFRVLGNNVYGFTVRTLAEMGFTVSAGLNFTAATTYVKYLQIDNKIFALSNAGEAMRLFHVGEEKKAKALKAIQRPGWNVADKLTVVHPDAGWLTSSTPTSVRTNMFTAPDMENLAAWSAGADTAITKSPTLAHTGTNSMRLESLPEKTNLCPAPLSDVAGAGGVSGWQASTNTNLVAASGSALRATSFGNGSASEDQFFVRLSAKMPVKAGETYRASLDWVADSAAEASVQGIVRVRWYNASDTFISMDESNINDEAGRRSGGAMVAPAGATGAYLYIGMDLPPGQTDWFEFKNVLFSSSSSTTFFNGASGANYFWTGTAHLSTSVYHPPKDVTVYTELDPLSAGTAYYGTVYVRAGSTVRTVNAEIDWKNGGSVLSTTVGASAADSAGAWTRYAANATSPSFVTNGRYRVKVAAVPRGEYHYVDSGLFEQTNAAAAYFDGNNTDTATIKYDWAGTSSNSKSTESTYPAAGTLPPAETKTAATLISSTPASNTYNFGFFYTFNNEIGETAASQATVVRAQRGWAAWRWETANASGEPSGTATADPAACADQLVAYMPQPAYDAALDAGATHWNLYVFTWSDQDPVPVMAQRIAQKEMRTALTHAANGWARMSPQMADAGDRSAPLPNANNLRNYSDPSKGGQGLVAADRMIVVNDPTAAAVIRWSSNQQGSYTDFSAALGGGYKTLTSGNLMIPACVKLWQNPQSVDTLTILCMGVDGQSTGYYMAPSQVASQSEATNIMGFEETTATPGTVSPYGVEVYNNALYHPIDEQIMKSTANNYNISHKSITDQIQNVYRGLVDKHHIVSSQHDNRLYYLVNNPLGAPLPDNCWGNEVWVFDGGSEGGSWSRWLTPGISLRKIDRGGKVVMSLVKPEGIYYFDEELAVDEVWMGDDVFVDTAIPWKLETNTQGANRAHDAQTHLQQCNVTLGNFSGQLRYGVRGLDVHGKRVDKSIIVRDDGPTSDLAWDLETFLLVQRDLKEWFFYAEAVVVDDVVQPCAGQINLVQYRYTPISVNAGYEFGSTETLEYGRAGNPLGMRTNDNGVPMPYVDTARP